MRVIRGVDIPRAPREFTLIDAHSNTLRVFGFEPTPLGNWQRRRAAATVTALANSHLQSALSR